MATDVNMNEVLITPLATMVREISSSVAAAQRELDAAALASQARLADEHPELQALGYQVTWYQIPEANVEMRMALHFERPQPTAPARLYLAPFNTKYRNTFGFSADGSSSLKLRIVPGTPAQRLNGSTMATTFVPFDPGKLTDDSLRNLELVRGKFNEAVQAVNVRDTEIQRLNLVNSDLQRRAADADQSLAARSVELEAARKELATQAGRVQDLSNKLKALQDSPPKIGVQDLVGQFKANVDRINADVISQKSPGMLVDNVEVEVRGGIDVQDGLHITQLPASALGVSSVSVLRFNLRPSSALKIVDDEPDQR